ncbi:hypothetical protein C4K29_2280 [Pseudomonas chlororaphis subsp. piscium]|nr:hypothetical protein C4K29_2280 [Pseudomonas chlororaphis subsp. piscium]
MPTGAHLAFDSRYSLPSRQLPPAFNPRGATVSERRQKHTSIEAGWVAYRQSQTKHLARIKGLQSLKTKIPMQESTGLPV